MAKFDEYIECHECGKVRDIRLGYYANWSDEEQAKDKDAEIERLKKANNWCNDNCEQREREREQNDPNSPNFQLETISFNDSIKEYFKQNSIQNIKLSDDGKRLLINGQERTPGIGEIFAKDLDVKKYLTDNNKKTLDYSELDNIISSPLPRQDNPNNQDDSSPIQDQPVIVHKPFTTKLYEFYQTPTFWTIAIIVGVMDLIYLYFYFFERKKLKEKLKQSTPLKIFTFLLAIASVIILIIPIFFLLASLGGGNEKVCGRCHRKSGNCCC